MSLIDFFDDHTQHFEDGAVPCFGYEQGEEYIDFVTNENQQRSEFRFEPAMDIDGSYQFLFESEIKGNWPEPWGIFYQQFSDAPGAINPSLSFVVEGESLAIRQSTTIGGSLTNIWTGTVTHQKDAWNIIQIVKSDNTGVLFIQRNGVTLVNQLSDPNTYEGTTVLYNKIGIYNSDDWSGARKKRWNRLYSATLT